MKIPGFRRLNKGDFEPDYQSLIDKMGVVINQALDSLTSALNNNISIKDNIACTVKDITLTADSNGKPKNTTSFQISTTGQIQGLSIIKIDNLTNSTGYPTNGVVISYSQNNSNIIINHITGLIPNNEYQLRIISWG